MASSNIAAEKYTKQSIKWGEFSMRRGNGLLTLRRYAGLAGFIPAGPASESADKETQRLVLAHCSQTDAFGVGLLPINASPIRRGESSKGPDRPILAGFRIEAILVSLRNFPLLQLCKKQPTRAATASLL
jgi:hypothetical protein